jgi:hypothetical protein
MRQLRLSVLGWFGVSLASFVWAQSDRGAIVGTITDPSEGVVPHVQVRAIHQATNVVHATVTTSSGEYNLPQLPVGVYRIELEAKGFKQWAATASS